MAKALFVVAALLASVAFAQTCDTVTNNVYRASACAGYTACTTALCTCGGNAGTSETCLSASTANCSTFNTCVHSYFMCLDMLANVARSNVSDPCNSWAVSLHAQLLTATVGTYNGSALQTACGARACELKNRTSLGTSCSMGTNYSTVCRAPMATTTVAPATTLPATTAPRYAVRVSIRLSGNWTSVLANATAVAQLKVALAADLAVLLGIEASFIEIISLTSGSLIVDFAVREGSNASVSQLENRANAAATSTTWLSRTTAVSAANGGPTSITTTVTIVTTTVAGQTTAAPSTTSSAASVSAAFVGLAALLALVF